MSLACEKRAPEGALISVILAHEADFGTVRDALRRLVFHNVPPADVSWSTTPDEDLFGARRPVLDLPAPPPDMAPKAPKGFVDLAQVVACHKDRDRFALLHRLLERLQHERALLRIATDIDVARAETMAKNVRRCSHKMKAFVRFRQSADPDGTERYVAWFEPEHHTLDLTAGFFVRRFANMRWSILTPGRSAHYDGTTLQMGPGADRSIAPSGDVNEELWQTYFASIFNPARLKVRAMQSEMPKRYWKNMPEGELVKPLIESARRREHEMLAAPALAPARSTRISRNRQEEAKSFADAEGFDTLEQLAAAARRCERCPLHRNATQVVPGEGAVGAPLMFVGEQPGDQEDIAGRPFVGPAGEVFDRALKDAGIARSATFVTNAVKHFKFEPRGKRRIHQKPTISEIDHCRFWLTEERRLVKPKLTVALGATAARALTGKTVTISKVRGEALTFPDGTQGFVTVHPSYLLRLPDASAKRVEYDRFVADLSTAWRWVEAVP